MALAGCFSPISHPALNSLIYTEDSCKLGPGASNTTVPTSNGWITSTGGQTGVCVKHLLEGGVGTAQGREGKKEGECEWMSSSITVWKTHEVAGQTCDSGRTHRIRINWNLAGAQNSMETLMWSGIAWRVSVLFYQAHGRRTAGGLLLMIKKCALTEEWLRLKPLQGLFSRH